MKKRFDIIRLITGLVGIVALIILELTLKNQNLGFSYECCLILPISLVLYFLLSYDLFIKTFNNFRKKQFFNEITLSLIATIAAFAIGEYVEAVAIILFYQIGEKFESYAVNKSRDSIESILNLRPDSATLLINNEEIVTEPFNVEIGSLILVKPGERVPLDGIVYNGNSTIDTSSITGESIPRHIKEGETILSGVINLHSPLIIKTTKEFYNSTISQVLDLVENASNSKTNSERFITKFSKYYTPIVLIVSLLVAVIPPLFLGIKSLEVWSKWVISGASLLVISCPCALVLSIPMAYFVSIGTASKNNVLIKGSTYLDKFRFIKNIVLDKTGTLTKGNFKVSEINSSIDENEFMDLVIAAETYSNHPIANAIKAYKNIEINKDEIEEYLEIEGQGISCFYKNNRVLAGNSRLMKENSIDFKELNSPFTTIYVARNNEFLGSIIIKDEIKETSFEAIESLHNLKIKNISMLTGDNLEIAESVSNELKIDHHYANLLPIDKVDILKEIQKTGVTAYIGDGINDAPCLTTADIGISMGGIGSDITIESSDAIIMNDNLNEITKIIKLSKKTNRIVIENLVFAISTKLIIAIFSVLPFINSNSYIMWLAIFADVGVTVICVLNSLRLLRNKR